HRVEVAGGDAEEEAGAAEAAEVVGGAPVGLRDQADAQAAALEEAGDEDGAEGGVVDVGVAADDDDVELGPAAGADLVHRRREEGVVVGAPAATHEAVSRDE